MKKKMFYEMRLKHARRQAEAAVNEGAVGKDLVIGELEKARVALDRAIKSVTRTNDDDKIESASPQSPSASLSQSPLLQKLNIAKTSILIETEATMKAFHTCRVLSRAMADERERRMMVELETGGNVRLEDGSPGKDWRDECAALVRARFRGTGARLAGDDGPRVSGLRVTRVTRITNRALRERYEKAVIARADQQKREIHLAKVKRIEKRAVPTREDVDAVSQILRGAECVFRKPVQGIRYPGEVVRPTRSPGHQLFPYLVVIPAPVLGVLRRALRRRRGRAARGKDTSTATRGTSNRFRDFARDDATSAP